MDFGMHVSVVCVLCLVVRGVFPHVFYTRMVLAYTAIGMSCHVCELLCVLSLSASAEHLTININHLSCRGLCSSTFSHP